MGKTASELNAIDKRAMRKRFLTLVSVLFLVNLAILIAINTLFFKLDREKNQSDIDTAIKLASRFIQHDFEANLANINFLSDSQPIRNYMVYGIEPTRNEIENLFINLAIHSTQYAQIRLLDNNGQELVRVDYRDGHAFSTPHFELQDKASRYYVKESLALDKGRIYISQLDLNMEQDRIEEPYMPMMRYGTALYDSHGRLQGTIILNYFGDLVLNTFKEQMKSISSDAMLINQQGYWLSNNDKSLEWGFMLGNNHSLKNQNPPLWDEMSELKEGSFIDIGKRYSWIEVPNKETEQISMEDSWKIVVVESTEMFTLAKMFSHLNFLYPALCIYIIGLLLVWLMVKNEVLKKKAQRDLIELNHSLQQKVADRTKELMVTKDVTIMSMATLAETRDNETGQHLRRTQNYVRALGNALKVHPNYKDQLNDDLITLMYKSAPLHDIGKIAIPDRILLKPGKLTPQEFHIMKEHATLGANAISSSIQALQDELQQAQANSFLNVARDIAHYHHERWDGSGYPLGLKGEHIPLPARIMAIADVFDALSCKRVYKASFSKEKTMSIMREGRGNHFDPTIYDVFISILDEFWDIRDRYLDMPQQNDESVINKGSREFKLDEAEVAGKTENEVSYSI
ncbi:HD domain-containing protein [Vibrio lamellibrachiae]|uniref:HD domain-containing phosphohydrolase n=1 Tax=Vibrio lamellibrachiae TaxID=2910253 RepID=UPI003D10388A